ncbi:MAG TPA: hypothetical protein VGQ90_02525 [Stellaceae bacterium]|nr:hypothetical protein [Stellaceae bacterium]
MTALPELSTDDAGATGRHRLAEAGGLLCLVLLAVALRLVPIVFAPSMNWGDEIFQTTEQAHRLVYGYGLVPWEFQVGMRSWLLPGAIAGLIDIARMFGDGPAYYLPIIAVGLGLLSAAPVVCCFLWCRRFFGLAPAFVAASVVAVAPELVYFGARALNEVVAAHLLVIAFYLIAPGYQVADRRRLVGAGALLGIIALLRLQLAPAVAVAALWPTGDDWRRRLPAIFGGGVLALAAGAAFDWLTLGQPLASVWRNLYYNLYLGISSEFSVEPWLYYLLGELGVWLAAAPFVLLLVALGARRLPALLAVLLVIVAVHSAIPHKEYRFIYPAVVPAMVLVAVALAELTRLAGEALHRRGVRRRVAATLAAVVMASGWCAVAFGVWSGAALAALRSRAHNELLAMSFVQRMTPPCGIGLYGENAWVRYGGYTYLHRPVPMYWPADEGELTADAAAFDTLIYDSADVAARPISATLGFTPAQCFGEICVARRTGGCTPRPLPQMWFPPQLRAPPDGAGPGRQ